MSIEPRVLNLWDVLVLCVLNKLLDRGRLWFTKFEIFARVRILVPFGTSTSAAVAETRVNYCLNRFVAEGIIVRCYTNGEYYHTFSNLALDLMSSTKAIADFNRITDAMTNNIQAAYERAVAEYNVALRGTASKETVCDSVAAVYNRRLTKRIAANNYERQGFKICTH